MLVNLENVSSKYGNVLALRDISIQVAEGELVTLIGANGAGKSTTLKVITGIVRPRTGNVIFDGKDISRISPREVIKRGVVHVLEGRQIFPLMTVLENLEVGCYLPKARQRKNEVLKRIYGLFPILEERKGQLSSTLSGGEQQMLAVGRALMCEPRLILFDEISLGLAPLVIKNIYQQVKQINSEGITALLVEQDIQRSLKAAHKVYIMQSGKIRLEGKPGDLSSEDIRKAYFGL